MNKYLFVSCGRKVLRLLLLGNRVNGRSGANIGEGHFDRVLDRMQELNNNIGHVAER